MTWQITSFVVLGLALLAGFAWYERSRPPAKVVALVAALAALAVVGRLAFAPIPNVQATTDIVLLTGYSLGGAPGFCVGAVTALVSNFFFLQGPWTPWQMVAWGGVGVAGAGLALLVRGRELGRVSLALACGVAGLAFGAFMDVHVWTLGAEQTLGAYVAVAGTSLSFNIAHAIGNVGLCLLIGPPLVRALRRYRERSRVQWAAPADDAPSVRARPGLATGGPPAFLLLAAIVAAGSLAAPATADASPTGKAARYLAKAQNGDGGFGGSPRDGSNQLHTGWAGLGLAAAGRNPHDVTAGGRSVIDYVRRGVDADTGSLSRTILLLTASGTSPRSFGGRDLVSELRRDRRRDGSFDGLVNQTAFAVMALEAAGSGSRKSVSWLQKRQNENGGYGFNAADGSPEDTGYVLEALVAAGRRGSPTVRRAVAYMEDRQRSGGGYSGDGTEVNAQATAFAVQGLVAAGRSGKQVRRGIGYLRSLQTSNGSIRYARGDSRTPVWVTAEALPAMQREPFPLPTVPRSRGGGSGGGAAPAGEAAALEGRGAPGAAPGGAGAGSLGGAGDAGEAGGDPGDGRRQRSEGSPERGEDAGQPGTATADALLDTGLEAIDGELASLTEEAPGGRGSVLGGVIAAASSAVMVVGIRRRLRKGVTAAAGAAPQAPPP